MTTIPAHLTPNETRIALMLVEFMGDLAVPTTKAIGTFLGWTQYHDPTGQPAPIVILTSTQYAELTKGPNPMTNPDNPNTTPNTQNNPAPDLRTADGTEIITGHAAEQVRVQFTNHPGITPTRSQTHDLLVDMVHAAFDQPAPVRAVQAQHDGAEARARHKAVLTVLALLNQTLQTSPPDMHERLAEGVGAALSILGVSADEIMGALAEVASW